MSIIRRANIFDPFSLDLWDPFEGLSPFFSLSGPRSTAGDDTPAFTDFRIDWRETPEAHVIQADLPGLKKEEVKVEVEEGRVLQISGERRREHEEKNGRWHRVERNIGKFLRRFRLPENAKVDHVQATMESGVLTVLVPKEEVRKLEVKAIEISGGSE
ncbi:18.2 kDa class I heat shock protein [Apostasia shenzhenica]|uniref:18.2 kDa class I heat shock protein n=1 Tax=Apostasia shenzhenica TaxID=1088818 RepID=A0A2I0B4S9_9ASPA|nr:18.2 kDa class I heat shock protein [Apostasia shenzhenica]